MTELSADRGRAGRQRRLGQMRAEHRYWMLGEDRLKPGEAIDRVVRMPSGEILNRYWDDSDRPRDESWREDVALAHQVRDRAPGAVYRDIRAAAESGWDFSSRWMKQGKNLSTLRTTDVVPVDLNSLMYGMERVIARECAALGHRSCAIAYARRANRRRQAMERFLWNEKAGFYADYWLEPGNVANEKSAAMAFPLFTMAASRARARRTAAALTALIAEGGLATTDRVTGQQWDAPNGWAPLQWVAVAGLREYGEDRTAAIIERRWLASVLRQYCASGRLLEKYDVTQSRPGGGGEYPLQDGFGWTNGVTLEMLGDLAHHGAVPPRTTCQ
jgi:alpha,alpha-trehalase